MKQKSLQWNIYVKDINWLDEDLGHFELLANAALTKSGQVWVTWAEVRSELKHPASKYLSFAADVSSMSYEQDDTNYSDIRFTVHVGGPDECQSTTDGSSVGVSVGGVSASVKYEHSQAISGKSRASFHRAYRIPRELRVDAKSMRADWDDIDEGQSVINIPERPFPASNTWEIVTYGGYMCL